MQKGKKNRRCSDYHSQENVDIVQKMIEGDLDTSSKHVGGLLGNMYWLGRKIVKKEIEYKSYIHRNRQFISNAVNQKRMECKAHMKHVWDTNLWPLSFLYLNHLDNFV